MAETVAPRELIRWGLVAAVSGVAAFAVSARFGFVYDDHWTIEQNRWLDEPFRNVFSALLDGTANGRGIPDATRPAMVASLWLDRHVFGSRPAGYHVHSLLLYGGACFAAAWASFSILRERSAAVIASLFFALAPVHAEVVSAVNYREDLICAVGVLIPLAWLFRPDRAKDSVSSALAIAAVALWGLCGKESAVFLSPLVILVALLQRVDREWLEARERTLWFIGAATILWLNWRLALTVGADGIPRAPATGAWTTLCDTARFVVRAVGASFLPFRPSPEYDNLGAAGPLWLLAVFALAALFAGLARRETTRPFALALGISIIAPLGASPLFRPVNPWADRYAFLGVLGGAIAVGYAAARWNSFVPVRVRVAGAWGAAFAAGVACTMAARVWADDRSVWAYAVERAPSSARAWAALSRVERLSGNLDAADRFVERALSIKPGHVQSHITRVYNLLARGDVAGARDEIARVEALGGAGHPGIRRARACAAGGAEEAKRCIREGG